MKLTYDLRHNTAYMWICEKPAYGGQATPTVETVHVSDELNVVVALDGFAERALFVRIDAVPGNP